MRAILICPDNNLAEQLSAALGEAGGVDIVRTLDRYPEEVDLARLIRAFAPQLVLISLASLEEAISAAKGVEVYGPGIQIVGVHSSCDSALLLEIMRAGVREFLYPPFDLIRIQEALQRVREVLERTPPAVDSSNLVYSFLPAKAGVGTSTVALNLALFMAGQSESRVLLADFDLNSGVIGFMLKLEHSYSLAHAAENSLRLDENLWPQLVSPVGRLDVIPAGRINVGFRIEPAQIRKMIDFARRHYEAICVDLSGNLEKYSIEVMHESKRIFVVTTPEIPALHLARQRLSFLRSLELEDRIAIVLNRTHKRPLISSAEIEKLLGLPIFTAFPNDYEGVHKALASGRSVDSSSALGKRFQAVAESLLTQKELPAANKRRFVEYFSLLPARYSMPSAEEKNS